nr:phage tape measure protein [uncultured Mediterranean phage uvMED]
MAKDVTLLIKLRDQVSGKVRAIAGASKKAEVQIKKLERAVRRTGIQLERLRRKGVGALKTIADKAKNAAKSFGGFGKAAALAAAAAGAAAFAKFSFGAAGELQRQTKSLEVLTGSLDTAKGIISELKAFGAVTPFTSQELIETSKRLKAFGFETDQVVDVTKRLADVAGATGADLGGIATAFGQIQAKGRLQTEELLQLQERGVGLSDELQKMYGITGEEFSKALEKGQISAEAANVALIRLTEQGGKYANGAVAQSDTLFGKLSTLQDAFITLGQNIGQALAPIFDFLITQTTRLINAINGIFDRNQAINTVRQREGKGRSRAQLGRFMGSAEGQAAVEAEMEKIRNARPTGGGPTKPPTVPELLKGRAGTGKTDADKAAEDAERIAEASADRVRSLEQQTLLASALTAEERTQFERQIQIAEILENKKGLTEDQIKAELQATTALFEQQDATKQLLDTNKQLTAEQQKQIQFAEQLAQTIEQGIKGAIMGAIDGSKSLSESLSGILRQLGGMFLSKGIGSFNVGGKGGSGLLGLLPGFANGGRPPVGRPSIVGERGPELFVPSRAGTIIPNNQLGGSTSVVVNVDASGTEVQGNQGNADQLGRLIGQAVQAELIKQKRPGGLLTR